MPWTIATSHPEFVNHPEECPECNGSPPDSGNATGQCSTCGAILVSADPDPGELFTVTLVPVSADLQPLPRRLRRSIQIKWGDKRQSDGSLAKIFRLIDRQNNKYIEKIIRSDGTRLVAEEPLSSHRGHGSDRRWRHSVRGR